MPKAWVPDRLREVLEMVGLWERAQAAACRRSPAGCGGASRSPAASCTRRACSFLDEPTVGLDPQTRASIWTYIHELREREEITIFLTTHYMDEAENCDRIAIMDAGKVVVLDTPDRLKASIGTDPVQFTTADDDAAIAALRDRMGLTAEMHDGMVTFGVSDGQKFVPRLFAELGQPIRSVQVARPSLDDVFMSYTGRTIRDAEANATDHNRAFVAVFRR